VTLLKLLQSLKSGQASREGASFDKRQRDTVVEPHIESLSASLLQLYIVLSEEQCSRTDPMKLAAVQLASTVALSALWEA
jgi:hypothetical protein